MPSLRGTLSFDHAFDGAAVVRHLVERLHNKRARFVNVHQGRIHFGGGFFRMVNSWNVLNPFHTGDISVDANAKQIHYDLNITQDFLIGTAMTALFGVGMVAFQSASAMWVLPILWLWLVGMNLVFGIIHFRDFLRKSVPTGGVGGTPPTIERRAEGAEQKHSDV